MKLEDIKEGMLVNISSDLHNKSFKIIGRNMEKEKLAGTVQLVDKIIYQKNKNRYIIRIKGNHWFPEDLDPIDLNLSSEIYIKPQIFDPNQLVIE